jgi:hypothetical protein
MKRCAISSVIRKTQIKTTMRYHLTPIRTAFTNKDYTTRCQEFDGSTKWYSYFGKLLAVFMQLSIYLLYDQIILLLGIY